MSDTFDHEGDAWSSYESTEWGEQFDEAYSQVYCGVVCQRCGVRDVKWRTNHNGKWQLFNTKVRGEQNQLLPHVCKPVSVDDFEVLT